MDDHQLVALIILPVTLPNFLKLVTKVKDRTDRLRVGHGLLVAYDISNYFHFCISANRFCCLVFPLNYRKIFNPEFTRWVVILCFFSATIPSFYLYCYHDCKFYVDPEDWSFVFSTTPSCQIITHYAVIIKDNTIVFLVAVLDMITVSKVHYANQKLYNASSTTYSARRKRETNFLKQACLQAVLFTLELLTYFVITPRIEHKWIRFFTSTVAWVVIHAVGGMITLYFNKEFYGIFARSWKVSQNVYN